MTRRSYVWYASRIMFDPLYAISELLRRLLPDEPSVGCLSNDEIDAL